jgi:hypothetical protein
LDVNMGQTIPLHEAARRNDTSVLELLLKHPSMWRRSAIHLHDQEGMKLVLACTSRDQDRIRHFSTCCISAHVIFVAHVMRIATTH